MRLGTFVEAADDLPPPPYTPNESVSLGGTAPASPDVVAPPAQTSLQGGFMRPSVSSETPLVGTNVTSPALYFDERYPSFPNGGLGLDLVEHSIVLAPDTTRDDLCFPSPIETYIDRDVSGRDWLAFVSYLFPALNKSANEKVGNQKGFHPRAFTEEDTPERRQRIQNIVAEWNAGFFGPRLLHINADFTPVTCVSVTANAAVNSNRTLPDNQRGHTSATSRRSRSFSSTSSSSSSSLSSVDSIKSKDLEGADINTLRSALLAFHLDENKKTHLRQSVRQLRDEFRSHRRDLPREDRKGLRKEFKDQRKELKREIKAIVKEVKTTRKAERKLRKFERKSQRHGKRAESRQDRSQRKLEKAERKFQRAQARAEGRRCRRGTLARQASDPASSCERGVTDADSREPINGNRAGEGTPPISKFAEHTQPKDRNSSNKQR